MKPEFIVRNLIPPNVGTIASRPDARNIASGDELGGSDDTGLKLIPAAVLIPLIERPHGISVILMQRTEHLNNHAGQISFPGGKAEPDDEGPIATALREAHEEIGLSHEFTHVMGLLDDYRTVTGFRITPVVTMIREGFDPVLDTYEVSEIFEVPLDFIFDPQNHQICSRPWNNIERSYHAFQYKDRFIWGATAGMLMNLYQRVVMTDKPDADV